MPGRPRNHRLYSTVGVWVLVLSSGVPSARAEERAPTEPVWIDASGEADDALFLTPEMTGEVIEVWAERPEKPFERDTELRLTRQQLTQRGATNLAEALDLLPELMVRSAGRGGMQINIRGARKGSIKILIDGVPISDPYYGNFDISSIPVTDIEQIRVSSSPGSPVDGTGGPGGVIEVHTRDAVGATALRGRFEGNSLPTSNAAATVRTMLGDSWAIRLSATGTLGSQAFQVVDAGGAMQPLGEERRAALGAARLEYRGPVRRLVVDSWASTRGFTVPPGEDGASDILVIDSETTTRNSVVADDSIAGWRLLGSAYAQTLRRDSRYFADPAMDEMRRQEDLRANREGASFLASRVLGSSWQIIGSAVIDSESADVRDVDGASVAEGRASLGELASGMRFERGRFQLDAAAGVAIPMGIGASPWPEAKVSAELRPIDGVSFKLIGGHKGRVPTLRERFEDGIGNQALGPEKVLYTELVVLTQPTAWLSTQISTFERRGNGQIRFDIMTNALVNLGELDTRGFEAQAQLFPNDPLGGGLLWAFIDAYAEQGGSDPLDFLPRNRAEAWVRGRLSSHAGGTLRLRFTGEQIDRQNVIDARTTVDVSAYGRLGEFTGSIRVDNLTDESYPIRAGVLAPGRIISLQLTGDWD